MKANLADRLVPVILAGGSGTRLWPMSRAAFPKHLVELVGDESLLQATARRLLQAAPAERILTVAAAGQAVLVRRQLRVVSPQLLEHLLLEPEPRNTAAAVAYAALHAREAFGEEAILWVCPSDHLILDVEALLDAVTASLGPAAEGHLVTFGIEPSRPETGFGWIARGDASSHAKAWAVERFVEKPPRDVAESMLREGGYLWNSGMFVMGVGTILRELEAHAPVILDRAQAAVQSASADDQGLPDPELYRAIPSEPIDKAVMERSGRVAVVPCDPNWSDVGSWRALWELMPKDEAGNAIVGDAVTEAAFDNFVRSEHRLVALAGVRELAVIETADAILVGDLANAEAVKAVVGKLGKGARPEAVVHSREHRPWGVFTNLASGPGFRVREVVVDPGGQLTLQRHDGRDEHWVVVEGRALVGLAGSIREIPSGNSVFVPSGTPHRLANAGNQILRIIEVQMGEILTEDATVRIDGE